MKCLRHLVAAAVAACAISASGVPAIPTPITFTQPDGSELNLRIVGDEFGHYFLTDDNQIVVRDSNDEFYFATVGSDGNLAPSKVRATDASHRTADQRAYLSNIDRSAMLKSFGSKAVARRAQREMVAGPAKAPAQATSTSIPQVGKGLFPNNKYPITGSPKALVILVQYSDYGFRSSLTTGGYFQRMLASDNFRESNATGSALEYFTACSDGKFTPQFDVLGPVTLPQTRAYYGGNDSSGNDLRPEYMVIHALQALDSTVDFSQYDTDGDGYIDNVYVIYAGQGEASGGASDSVWPHSWAVKDGAGLIYKFDGKTLNKYACSAELLTSSLIDGIGTFCHEFSHVMGLPDLYSTDYGEAYNADCTPGSYTIMDQGSYNNNSRTPPVYSAYERNAMGWCDLDVITPREGRSVTLEHILTSNKAALIAVSTNEFFLLENRQQTGWDKYLPGKGMLVWHIDYNTSIWNSNSPNNTVAHQYVDIVEAGGRYGSSYVAQYPFPGTKKVTSFTSTTTPALKSWAGASINAPITNIVESDGKITFDVCGGAPVVDPDPDPEPDPEDPAVTSEAYKYITFSSSTNSNNTSGYTGSFSTTVNGFTCNIVNFNNNSSSWDYIKCGNKSGASVATITTAAAIDKPITKVTVTIDEITASKVNSIKLYSSPTSDFSAAVGVEFAKAIGAQSVNIAAPASNRYYKIEFDCAKGSSNGLVTVSKVEFFAASGEITEPVAPDVPGVNYVDDYAEGVEHTDGHFLEMAYITFDSEATVYYTTDESDPVTSSTRITYDGDMIEVTATTTFKYVAYANGLYSDVAIVTLTKDEPVVDPDPEDPEDPQDPETGEYKYVLTDITDLYSGDVVVIVDATSSKAIDTSSPSSSSSPAVYAVTLNADKTEITSDVTSGIFTISVSGGTYTFACGDYYLYNTNANTGVRIYKQSGNTKNYTWSGGYLKNSDNSRYIGVYESQDWRCYTNTTGNISGTKTAFYKRVAVVTEPDPEPDPITVADPVFSLEDGEYEVGTEVTISCDTPDAFILYTINGGDDIEAPAPVTITITEDMYIEAYAFVGEVMSEVVTAVYEAVEPAPAQVATPVFVVDGTPISGESYTANSVISLAITCDTPDAEIYYSCDELGIMLAQYTEPITLRRYAVVEAMAVAQDCVDSETILTEFVFDIPVVGGTSEVDATFDFVNNSYGMTAQSGNSQTYNPDPFVINQGDITLTLNGTQRLWKLSDETTELRFHKSSSFTVSVPEDCYLVSVTLVGATKADWDKVEWTADDTATRSVTFSDIKTTKNTAIKGIDVAYAKAGAGSTTLGDVSDMNDNDHFSLTDDIVVIYVHDDLAYVYDPATGDYGVIHHADHGLYPGSIITAGWDAFAHVNDNDVIEIIDPAEMTFGYDESLIPDKSEYTGDNINDLTTDDIHHHVRLYNVVFFQGEFDDESTFVGHLYPTVAAPESTLARAAAPDAGNVVAFVNLFGLSNPNVSLNSNGGMTAQYVDAIVGKNKAGDVLLHPTAFSDVITGVEDIEADAFTADAVYYNLQGVRLDRPAPGTVVIIVRGATATKTLIK